MEAEVEKQDDAHKSDILEPIDVHLGMASALSQDEILSFLPEKGHMDVWTAAWYVDYFHM